jgi:hypothetical protein
LLVVVSGLLLSGSHFTLTPFGGDRSLLPMSLIIIATICMTYSLQHWTAMSFRRGVLGLVASLSASWTTAMGCMEGLTRREGVFRRTSKTGAKKRQVRTALRLSRWETVSGVALYVCAGLLSKLAHPPIVLIVIIAVQGTVYICSPTMALWNVATRRVPRSVYVRRAEKRRMRQATRRRPSFAPVVFAVTLLIAALVGAGFATLSAPSGLLPGTSIKHARLASSVHARPEAHPNAGRDARPALKAHRTAKAHLSVDKVAAAKSHLSVKKAAAAVRRSPVRVPSSSSAHPDALMDGALSVSPVLVNKQILQLLLRH